MLQAKDTRQRRGGYGAKQSVMLLLPQHWSRQAGLIDMLDYYFSR